jgi:hypothetical protein
MHRTNLLVALAVLAAGCTFDEGLIIRNLTGTVRVKGEAATRTVLSADGTEVPLTDAKFIGPVYLGLYPSVIPAGGIETYSHPERGPQYKEGIAGDTYPYGGTSIGDFRFSCFEELTCDVVSGRFVDFDDIIDWFTLVGVPVVDEAGLKVTNGDYMRQTCYDLLDVNTDREVRLTAEDRNEDGKIDKMDLDFVQDGEDFVAEFTIYQQEFAWDVNQEDCEPGVDCKGFSLWGFMDAPGPSLNFTTCDGSSGANAIPVNDYDAQFVGGVPYKDILNSPSKYITSGDWVSNEGFQWDDIYEQPELVIDTEVQ